MTITEEVASMAIAELEDWGLDVRSINVLEAACGLFVRDVVKYSREALMVRQGIGEAIVGKFLRALEQAAR